jgi:hypothetical protein
MRNGPDDARAPWLLLIHQIPPKPDYLRVKIGRRLQRIGAVPVKNSVYVLPDRPASLEDFQWIRAEIVDGGGDAWICRAAFVDGLTDGSIEHLFRDARDADYAEIAEAARELRSSLGRRDRESARQTSPRPEDDLARLRKRFTAIVSIDFFGAAGRTVAEEGLRAVTEALRQPDTGLAETAAPDVERAAYRGRTWVTRRGVFVDRMASAWLIRRFIDRDARFRFVAEAAHRPAPRELRFDMFEGEFTHEGDRCTFETLLERFRLDDPALRAIAEIVHDIDLKDEKFGREDATGIAQVFAGITAATADDLARLERGAQVLDELHALFSDRPDSAAADSQVPHSPDT